MEAKPIPLETNVRLGALLKEYWTKVRDVERPVAWCYAFSPSEILRAAGIYTVFPENHCATCAAKRVSDELCDAAAARGYSPDLCSYSRTDLGSVFSGKSPVGGLPKPDLFLCCTTTCVLSIKWFEALVRELKVPVVTIDVPFMHDDTDEARAAEIVAYVTRQLEELIRFLEDFTGRRYDYDRLREVMRLSERCSTLWHDILSLPKHRPAPLEINDAFVNLFPVVCMRGTPEGVAHYELMKAELEERVAKGIGALPRERYRLYWENVAIWPQVRAIRDKFASHDACLVYSSYPSYWTIPNLDGSDILLFDYEKPVQSLAKVLVYAYLNRGPRFKAKMISRIVEEYAIDAVIIHRPRTCRLLFMGDQDIRDEVMRQTGRPGLILEGDHADSRYYSHAQAEERIDAFMAGLAAKAS